MAFPQPKKDPVKKKHIIQALAAFNDEDEVAIGETVYLGEVRRICGKGQYGMAYVCAKPPGHSGKCYCFYKNVYFTPDPEAK
jgi:hypothetical protein